MGHDCRTQGRKTVSPPEALLQKNEKVIEMKKG